MSDLSETRRGRSAPRAAAGALTTTLLAALAACTIQERTDRNGSGAVAEEPPSASEFISPWGEAEPPRAVRSGDLIWIWGMPGVVPGATPPRLVEGGAAPEARQALANIRAVLVAAGGELRDAAQCSLFVADSTELPAVLEVYREYFPAPPLRAAVATGELAMGGRVELECTAVLSGGV